MNRLKNIKPKKIAIFRALQLGDMLCVIPAVRALKKSFPDSRLILIGLPWAKEITTRFSNYFSGFISFPGYPGLPEQPYDAKAFRAFMNTISKENFDMIIQMQGNGTIINPMIESLGVKNIAGFYTKESYKPDSDLFIPYPEKISEVERHMSLVKHLGAAPKEKHLEFPLFPEEELEFILLAQKYELHLDYYVVVHPGASDVKKRWSAKNFAKVIKSLLSLNYKVVLTGTRSEIPIGKEIERLVKTPVVNLIGKTSLAQLSSLIKDAEMLISNDTGVSHIASAVKTKSLILFHTTDPVRWAPLNRKLHHIILPDKVFDADFVVRKMEKVLATL